MPVPIKGSSGNAKIGAVNFTWVGSWEATVENKTETIGPHLGDPNEYDVETSQRFSFKITGTIPEDGDTAQDALFDAVINRDNPALELWAVKGKKLTFAADTTVYSKLVIKQDAKGTHTFEAEGAGPATLADGPAS
jgi:hypothetical protein